MSARSEAAKLIKSGCSPNYVAKQLGKTKRIAELIRLLLTSVGEGELLLSEIYFSIPEPRREQFHGICEEIPEIDLWTLWIKSLGNQFFSYSKIRDRKVSALGPDYGIPGIECSLYWFSKDSPYTDTYRFLRELETTLFHMIRETLRHRFRIPEIDWWDKGVRKEIRERCEAMEKLCRKDDLGPWCHMNFIDFKVIIKDNWDEFYKVIPPDIRDGRKKKQLLDDLQWVNGIRNNVMHPIKRIEATPLDEGQCKRVRKLAEQLRESRWRPPVRHRRFGKN